MAGNPLSWKKREMMEMKDTVKKKQVSPSALWTVS